MQSGIEDLEECKYTPGQWYPLAPDICDKMYLIHRHCVSELVIGEQRIAAAQLTQIIQQGGHGIKSDPLGSRYFAVPDHLSYRGIVHLKHVHSGPLTLLK